MALPTQRRTKAYRKNRAVQYRLKKTNFSKCSNCEKPVLSHRTCLHCGHYSGRRVIDTKK